MRISFPSSPAPSLALANFAPSHQRVRAGVGSRLTAGLLTAALYALLIFLARLEHTGRAPPAQPEVFAILLPDAPAKKILRSPPPFLAHLLRPHAQSIAPPAFTVTQEAPAATLPATTVASSPIIASITAGTDTAGQGISAKGISANGRNGTGDELAGCWDRVWAQAVADRVRKFSYYPRRARDDGVTGVVMVHVSVRRLGRLALAKIEKSSGHTVLDRAAIGMVYQAQPLPPIPDRMHVDRVDGVLPIEFGKLGGTFKPSDGNCNP